MAAAAPFIIMAVATVLQASAQQRAGEAAKQAGEAQALGLENQATQHAINAGQARAFAQREGINERRQERLVQSRLQATAAASGTNALSPGIVDISEDIAGEGEYRFLSALYQGEERARGENFAAQIRRFEAGEARRGGGIAQSAGNMSALTTIFSNAGQMGMYAKYGGGGAGFGGG